MKKGYFFLAIVFVVKGAYGQTNPTAQTLPYSENFDALLHISTAYPSGIQGWTISTTPGATFNTSSPTADKALVASSTAATNSGNVHNYNGKIGYLNTSSLDLTVVVAINTSGFSNIQVGYDIMTIRNPYDGASNTRINEVTLQYRIGTSGSFTNLAGIEYQNNTTTQTTAVTTPQNQQAKNITLPSGCDNQAVIQLRWASRQVSGGGSRPSFAFDNISISGTVISTSTLNVNPSSLSFGSQATSTQSVSQSFNLSGSNLSPASGNITVSAPSTDFEVSNDNSTWGSTTPIAYTGGVFINTPVYVRFTPQTVGSKSGDVTFSGGGVTTPPTVALSGIGTKTFYSKSTGTLTNVANWGDVSDGSGTAPLNFTDDGQIFTIANRVTETLDANWTVSGAGAKVVTGNGTGATELIIPSSFTLTGTCDVANNGTLTMQNTTLPTLGIFSSGSTVNFAQAGTSVIPAGTYHNLTLTNGTKTLASGTTTINGNLVVDAVAGFNGSASPFSTVNLAGNFTLQNSAAFEPNPTGDGNRLTLICTGSGGQSLAGGDFQLFRLQTPSAPATTLSISLNSANLLLGNASSGGLNLQQSTHELILNGFAGGNLTIRGSGFFSSTNVGTIYGASNSDLIIDKTSGSVGIGSIGFSSSGRVLRHLTYNSAGTGSNNLTLLSDINLDGTLTLTSGRIIIPELVTLLLTSSNPVSGTGFGASKHIVTNVNTGTGAKGFFRVNNISTAYTFPTGNGTHYLPVTVTPSAANDFSVCTFPGITVNGEPNGTAFTAGQKANVVDAIWFVNRNTGSGDVTMTTEWPAALEGAGFSSFLDAEIGIAHNNGTNWGIVAGTGNNTTNTATRTALSSFSPFGVGKVGLALPVKFANVKAYQQGSAIKVDWSNLTESNVVNYVVERSANGISFTALSTTTAARNNGGRADYTSLDVSPLDGVNFYRVRSNELDGKSLYSVIVKVNTKGGVAGITVYPNPVTGGQVSLQTNGLSKGLYNVRIFDAVGQQVFSQLINHNGGAATEVIQLPATIKPGMYNLQLNGGEVKLAKSFIIR